MSYHAAPEVSVYRTKSAAILMSHMVEPAHPGWVKVRKFNYTEETN